MFSCPHKFRLRIPGCYLCFNLHCPKSKLTNRKRKKALHSHICILVLAHQWVCCDSDMTTAHTRPVSYLYKCMFAGLCRNIVLLLSFYVYRFPKKLKVLSKLMLCFHRSCIIYQISVLESILVFFLNKHTEMHLNVDTVTAQPAFIFIIEQFLWIVKTTSPEVHFEVRAQAVTCCNQKSINLLGFVTSLLRHGCV